MDEFNRNEIFDTSDESSEHVKILNALFFDHISPEPAAEELAKASLEPEENIELTWRILLSAARQYADQQGKLIELLLEMMKLPPALDKNGEQMKLYDALIWDPLPMLGMEFN